MRHSYILSVLLLAVLVLTPPFQGMTIMHTRLSSCLLSVIVNKHALMSFFVVQERGGVMRRRRGGRVRI